MLQGSKGGFTPRVAAPSPEGSIRERRSFSAEEGPI